MNNITSSFNEIKIDGNDNKIYIGSKEKFEPAIDWLENYTILKVKGVGKRYSPFYGYEDINVSIDTLNNYFNSFVKVDFNFISESITNDNIVVNYMNSLKYDFNKIVNNIKNIDNDINVITSYNDLKNELSILYSILDSECNNIRFALSNESGISPYNTTKKELEKAFRKINNSLYILEDLIYRLSLNEKNIEILDKQVLLLTGEALIGKTHLFCDKALSNLSNNCPTLLFFGNEFSKEKTIINNMISILGISNVSENDFLNSLNILGVQYNTKTLIMIDAINETQDMSLWANGVIELCEKIKNYSNLSLALSVRDVEKNKLLNENNEQYIQNEIVEIEHKGFLGIEIKALETFCNTLNVEFPKVPIHTNRLFINPGMLFLYIETIKNTTKKINTDVINPTIIFKAYLSTLNRKFYQRFPNEIDEDEEIVHEAVNTYIDLATNKNFVHYLLNYKEVSSQLKPLHKKVLEFLISEGVLNKLKSKDETQLYFTYQKFENFFISEYLLNDFEKNKSIIFGLIKEYNGAISEALLTQIPEKMKKEIFDLDVWLIRDRYICEEYIDSLVWRKPNTVNEKTFKYLNFLLPLHDLYHNYLEVVLQLSSIPKHPLNIERLHKRLMEFDINIRDYNWSLYIYNSYTNDGIVRRVINWAWNKTDEFEINEESLYLYGLTLSWFLTSSNRELRDGATKALVNIFTNNINVFCKVLKEFENVNDLYVLERLYAVTYGIVLRSSNQSGFKQLGIYIYNTIFNVNFVIENILLREYASFSVEIINKIIDLDIDLTKIYPPYNQNHKWILPKIEKSEVEKYRNDYTRIYASTLSLDFKRYRLYSYANHFLNIKICDRPHKKLPKERYDDFFENLTEEQKKAYDKTRIASSEILKILNNEISDIKDLEQLESPEFDAKYIEELRQTKIKQSNFKELLTPAQIKEYEEVILNYYDLDKNKFNIDIRSIKRLVFLETLKFGWNKELFENFDKKVSSWDRHEHRSERIGKKYQWIALYEVLARLLDNYEYQNRRSENKISQYIGAFQFSVRNIDPTSILKYKTKTDSKWWFKVDSKFDNNDISNLEWMKSNDKLPKISEIINLENNDKDYLLLNMNFSIDGNKDNKKYRNLYYSINSFVVKKDALNDFKEFVKDKSFYARNMPHSSNLSDIYLREYPNSKAFKYFDNYYYSQVDWDDSFENYDENLPCKVLLTSTAYFNEAKSYDHSIENGFEISLPNKWFIEQMNLKQTLNDGKWVNQNEEVMFFDPTVTSCCVSPYNEDSVLVANKKALLEFLEQNEYTLIWVMWGEKQIRDSGDDFDLEESFGISKIDSFSYFENGEIVDNEIKVKYENES